MGVMSEKNPHPLVAEFIATCAARGIAPTAVMQEAGIHRSVLYRWEKGAFAPNMKNWGAAQTALERMSRDKAA